MTLYSSLAFTVAIAWILLTASLIGADEKAVQDLQVQAKKETVAGRHELADSALAEAIQLTRQTNNKSRESELAFDRALNLRNWIASGKAPDVAQSQLRKSYETVIESGEGKNREMACNNLAVWHLRQGTVDSAKEAVRLFSLAGEPATDPHTFYFNFGRALEQAKQPQEALQKYWLSINKQPRFFSAAEAAAKVLTANRELPGRNEEARRLLEFYDRDDPNIPPEVVGQLLYEMLSNWGNDAGAQQMLPFLASHLVRSRIDQHRYLELDPPQRRRVANQPPNRRNLKADAGAPERQAQDRKPRSLSADKSAGELRGLRQVASIAPAIDELAIIFLGGDPTLNADFVSIPDFAPMAHSPILQRPDIQAALPTWALVLRDNRTKAEPLLAALLMQAGDSFYRRSLADKEPLAKDLASQALKRFTAAFALDPTATEPALYAVKTLSEHAKLIDPNGKLSVEYSRRLFAEKSDLLLTAKTRADYARLQSLHIVLATIFEGQRPWGRAGDAATALFQWKAAIEDEEKVLKLDPTYPVSPDLRFRVAECHLKSESADQAPRFYLAAAELYLQVGKPDLAANVLKRAAELAANGQIQFNAQQDLGRIQELAARTSRAALKWDLPQSGVIRAVALSDRADRLILGERSRIAAVNLSDEQPVRVPPEEGYPWKGSGLAWLPETMQMVCGEQSAIEIWDGREFVRPPMPLGRHLGSVQFLSVGKTAGLFASLSTTGEVKIWSSREGTELRTVSVQFEGTRTRRLALSPDGKYLALSGQKEIRVVDVGSGDQLREMKTNEPVTCLNISADGKTLAAGMSDGQIQLWQLVSGEPLGKLTQGARLWELEFAPRGNLLAALDGGTVRLWDTTALVEVARLGSPSPPLDVTFSADGTTLAMGCGRPEGRGLVRVWDVSALLAE